MFRLPVPQADLDDLQERLARTRWPDSVTDGWEQGTPLAFLQDLVTHWREVHDWRATEARLGALDHQWSGGLHHVHAGTRGKPALLLLHGWPDSFLRYEKVLPLLRADFDLVVPSLPGYGFSDRPTTVGTDAARVADLLAELMTSLGLEQFGVHGGDLGTGIALQLASRHTPRVTGVHLSDVPYRPGIEDPDGAEQRWLDRVATWSKQEGAYNQLQRTKPQTLAYGLSDSPVGLAGWVVEKYHAWSDCGGDVLSRFTRDELCDHVTLYWLTGTAASSVRYYWEGAQSSARWDRTAVPFGFAIPPADIAPAPRAYAERFFDVRRWTDLPRGGHFVALEEPELLAAELRAFFEGLG